MDIELDALYEVKLPGGGRFIANALRFEREGHVVVLRPVRQAVRDVYPDDYQLGRAHWDDALKRVR